MVNRMDRSSRNGSDDYRIDVMEPAAMTTYGPIAKRVDAVLASAVGRDLSSWERFTFLPNIRTQIVLSPKQEKILGEIEHQVFDNIGTDDCE